jgi:hypothetical protein
LALGVYQAAASSKVVVTLGAGSPARPVSVNAMVERAPRVGIGVGTQH